MKKELRIGTWSVLALYKGGALKQLARPQNFKSDSLVEEGTRQG
jgi:hypothetical protein